jgi:uncharacterized glyoxalase superfamily protein PhnB
LAISEGFLAEHLKERIMSKFNIIGLNYVSLYPADHAAALAYYAQIFGPIDIDDPKDGVWGWRMGSTWLTVFPGKFGTNPHGNPQNVEFAIQVAAPEEVDRLYAAFVAAGIKASQPPIDTVMYEPMRYAYVDDLFGVRIDIYCPSS